MQTYVFDKFATTSYFQVIFFLKVSQLQ